MRVGFDAGPLSSSFSGIGQYVRCLFPAMFAQAPAIEWVAYAAPSSRAGDALPSYVSVHASDTWWSLSPKPQAQPDVFHGTNFKAPNHGQAHTVVTIHDVWLARHPQHSKKLFGQALSTWKLACRARRASRIIAVSHFSAKEIQDVLRLPPEQITVIHHGCSPAMFPDCDAQRFQNMKVRLGIPDRPYILFVGGAEPRKNHAVLFQAFARSPRLVQSFALVAVGDICARGANLLTTARNLNICDLVCCPGYVSLEDLRLLYSHADAFVFPSLYEGFGIPLLDAMSCGTPVITGRDSALPEVAGDAALLVDSRNAEQLGVEIERLLSDKTLQTELRKKGFERVLHFTWDRAAKETLNVYREVHH